MGQLQIAELNHDSIQTWAKKVLYIHLGVQKAHFFVILLVFWTSVDIMHCLDMALLNINQKCFF